MMKSRSLFVSLGACLMLHPAVDVRAAEMPHHHTLSLEARSLIAQPYPYVSGGEFSGEALPASPDPLVAYRWPNPRAADGLQVFLIKPKFFESDSATSFAKLDSLATESPSVEVRGTGSIRLDFGAEYAAWLEFDSPDCPGGVEMSISEYNEPAIVNKMPEHPIKTLAPVKHGNTYRLELNKDLYEGVRFGWIHVRNFTKPWHITGVRLVCQTKPVNYEGSFSCSDPMLTRVWYTGAYVVRLNLLKDYIGAILMDRGDRHSWTGDAHPTQAASLVAFGNYDFIRHNIERTSGKDGILSYRLYWALSVLDYWRYTGDSALLEKYIDNICTRLDEAYEVYGTEPEHVFYGWDERLGAGFDVRKRPTSEVHNTYKMLSIECWRAFAEAMGVLGRHELEETYQGYVKEKTADLKQNPNWYQNFGIHALSGAVNAGSIDNAEQAKIRCIEFNDRVQRLSFSPFNQYFILQAMADLNLYDEAHTSILDLWGGQIEYGGTTFFEVFRPSWTNALGKNDPVPNNQCGYTSLAHPWGAGVVKWLSEEVLGIKPLSPGFDSYEIVPHLGRTLTWVKGSVPTPHGEIRLHLNTAKGTAVMSAPAGTTGRIGIPKIGKKMDSITFNKTLVWDGSFHSVAGVAGATEDADFVYLNGVQAGTHQLNFVHSGTAAAYIAPAMHYETSCVAIDTLTQGNWGGKYGKDGHVLVRYAGEKEDIQALPAYVKSVSYDKSRGVRWAVDVDDPRALAPNPNNGFPRIAASVHTSNGGPTDVIRAWHSQPLTLNIELKERRPYRVALHLVDWDRLGRSIAVEMFDASSLKLLAPVQVIKDHTNGVYLVYEYDQSVRFRIQQIRGANATLSGIFFDPASSGKLMPGDPKKK